MLHFVTDFEQVPPEEKPREKLEQYGPSSLSLWELVAILLRTGTRSKSHSEDVMQLAKRVVAEAGFRGLFTQTDVGAVKENFGVYTTHARTIVAISEVCRRLHGKYDVFDASEPGKVFDRFRHLQSSKQEQCYVLHLDKDRKCVFQEMVAIGASDHVQVYPNDVLRTPLWIGTKEIIVVHNHPGSCTASKQDISWTLALSKGSFELHRIRMVDHVVIGNDGYFSFQEKGLL